MLSKFNWLLILGVVATALMSSDSAEAKDNKMVVMTPFIGPEIIRREGPCPGPACDAAGLVPHAVGLRTVYLNFDGVTLTKVDASAENAVTNRSWIVNSSTEVIPAFSTSDLSQTLGLSRSQIIQRVVNQMYASHAPYDVEFTTTRPSSGPYNMIVFGGTCSSVVGSSNCAGIAMGDCGDFLPSNITFVFPWGLRVDDLAATAAQEWAHAVGLGHTDDRFDVMFPSIQGSIIPDEFTTGNNEVVGPNGQPDGSGCGLLFQNSHQRMLDTIGPRGQDVVPPSVTITAPQNGATVAAGETISADASDASGVDYVEFRVGGDIITDNSAPYTTTMPSLASGNHNIVVWAHDTEGNANFAQITIYVSNGDETPCTNNDDCADGEECSGDICVPDNGLSGELGDTCEIDTECLTGICGAVGDEQRCTQLCDDQTPCPGGFECIGGAACWPIAGGGGGEGDGDGGLFKCSASTTGSGTLPTALLLLGAILFARRRRQR